MSTNQFPRTVPYSRDLRIATMNLWGCVETGPTLFKNLDKHSHHVYFKQANC